MSATETVIDLCSDDEDLEKPLHRRFDVDLIEGVEIFSFANFVEMEFFSQLDSPFTARDDRDFKGFGEVDPSVLEYKEFFKNAVESSISDDDCILVDAPVVFPKPMRAKHRENTQTELLPNPKFPKWISPSKPLIMKNSPKKANFLNGPPVNVEDPPGDLQFAINARWAQSKAKTQEPPEDLQGVINARWAQSKAKNQVAMELHASSIITPKTDCRKYRKCGGEVTGGKKFELLTTIERQESKTALVPRPMTCVSSRRLPDLSGFTRMRRRSPKKTKSPSTLKVMPVVDESVVGVVRDLVDFVCRKETQAEIPVLQDPPPQPLSMETELPPCRKEFCILGCICYSIGRKNIRRPRCANAGCIFGCCCWAKSERLRSGYIKPPSRFESLTWLEQTEQPAVTVGGKTTCAASVEKLKTSESTQTPWNNDVQINTKDPELPPTTKIDKIGPPEGLISSYKPLPFNKWRPNVLHKPFYSPYETFKKKKPFIHFIKDSPLQKSSEPQKFKVVETLKSRDAPAQALICLTPGVGFVPLEEMSSNKVQFRNPFSPSVIVSFLNVKNATEWLNLRFRERFNFGPNLTNLSWMVADATIIKRKDLKHVDVDVLANPKCQITRTGLIFM